MTRKHKWKTNGGGEQLGGGSSTKQQSSHHADSTLDRNTAFSLAAGYGVAKNYNNSSNNQPLGLGYSEKRPRHTTFNADHTKEMDFKRNFERKYGYTNTTNEKNVAYSKHNNYEENEQMNADEMNADETSQTEFPTELVSYLKNCATAIEEDPDGMDDTIRDKCLEECQGKEIELCFYESSSRLIERIFRGSEKGSHRWFTVFMKIKKARQFEALYMGCACRCLETLLFSLSTSSDIQLLEQLADLLVDGWNDLMMDINASHFIRSFVRHLIGLPKLKHKPSSEQSSHKMETQILPKEWTTNANELKKQQTQFNANVDVKRIFTRIVNLALDYRSMKDHMNVEPVSLMMQEMIEYDWFTKTSKTSEFVSRSIEDDNQCVLNQWKGQQSSRIWQIIVERVNEDGRQSLYHSVLNGNLLQLSLHRFANFVVEKFIRSAKSDELATDIFDELLDGLPEICENNKWSVVKGLINLCKYHEEHQTALLKQLRQQFASDKASTKYNFLPNIFTLNSAEISQDVDKHIKFDVTKGNLHGSLILQDLFMLKRNKTIIASLLALSKITVLELAHDQKGSYVLQAFFKSFSISDSDKFAPAAFLKKKWWELTDDPIASHVFDALWDYGLITMDEKQEIMLNFCESNVKAKKSSLRRIIMRRLDCHGFRENREKWLNAEKSRMANLRKNAPK